MFVLNDDLSIYVTRGDAVFFKVSAADENGVNYKFQPGDVVRIKVFAKKNAENVVLQKEFSVVKVTEYVEIFLSEADTKIGDVISKPVDYWYEIELNPYTNPQTIIGYDEDGARVFKLFPEGRDLEEETVTEEDIPVVDEELDMTSTRPVQNQAIARAVANLRGDFEATDAAVSKLHITPQMFGAIGDGEADDTQAILDAISAIGNGITTLYFPAGIYLVTKDIPLVSNMILRGDGRNSVITRAGNALKMYNVLLCNNLSNVTIKDIHIQGDRLDHTGEDGEWGMCISLLGCSDVTIENCLLNNGWGDGVYVGSGKTGCQNITIDNCVIDYNRRNGVSVIECDGFRLLNSRITNTDGTAPKAGIDFEPNESDQVIANCIVDNCIFSGNQTDVAFYDRSAVQAVVQNCYMNSKYGFLYDSVVLEEKAVGGVTVHNCNFMNTHNCFLSNAKHINSVPVRFVGCVMSADVVAIQIGGASTSYTYNMGDIHFVDCYIVKSTHSTGWARYQNAESDKPLMNVTLDVRLGDGVPYRMFYTNVAQCQLDADIKCIPRKYDVAAMTLNKYNTEPLICLNTLQHGCKVTLAHSVPFGFPITIRKLYGENTITIVNESESFGQFNFATQFSFAGRFDEVTIIHEEPGVWRVVDKTASGVSY